MKRIKFFVSLVKEIWKSPVYKLLLPIMAGVFVYVVWFAKEDLTLMNAFWVSVLFMNLLWNTHLILGLRKIINSKKVKK